MGWRRIIVPHPLYEFYLELDGMRKERQEYIEELMPRLKEAEAKLEALKRELILKYGPGKFKTKTVRNKKGKKYRYLVWVSYYDGKEHYLPKDALEVWDTFKTLKKEIKDTMTIIRILTFHMKPVAAYVDVCIDNRTGTYIKCSTKEPI